MKKILIVVATIFAITAAEAQQRPQGPQDWANYRRYAEANVALKATGARPDAVFMGNSITEGWARQHEAFFADNNYLGRGISSQVTAQMLARFRADVLELKPGAVVILAGTNDIAINQGFVAMENIAGNIISMAELAKAHGIAPVLCSVLPVAEYPWRREITDVPGKIREVNARLREWAEANGGTYVDFFGQMADERGGLSAELAYDGVHPTSAGYDRMEAILKPILDRVLKK